MRPSAEKSLAAGEKIPNNPVDTKIASDGIGNTLELIAIPVKIPIAPLSIIKCVIKFSSM